MNTVLNIAHIFDDLLSLKQVPLITKQDDIQEIDGNYRFCGTTKQVVNDEYWIMDFIPDKTNKYLSPEVRNITQIPSKIPVHSFLYGFAQWMLVELDCTLDELYPSSMYYCLSRCLVYDPTKRILRYV